MLWRFSFASSSTLDSLLSRETPPSVEEIMDDTEVLSECKAQNNKLVNFLSKDDSIKSLLQWVVSGLDELDEQARKSDRACLERARKEAPERYPAYEENSPIRSAKEVKEDTISPPLEPAKLAEKALEEMSLDEDQGKKSFDSESMDVMSRGPNLTEDDEASRQKYPNVAAEILNSELWVIPETILSNKETLLRPFWDAVVPPIRSRTQDTKEEELFEEGELYRARAEFGDDEDDERDRKREVIRGLWVKVNGGLITKRTTEMVRFIQSMPDIIPRLLAQISSPAIQDIIVRLIQSEEAGVYGVIAWLSEESLVPHLISLLSPYQPPPIQTIGSDLLKSVITLCAPPPFNPLGGNMQEQQSAQGATAGTRDNRMVREMVNSSSVTTLVGYMLDPLELSDRNWKGINADGSPHPSDPFIIHQLPSIASASSSLCHISSIFVELIRRNNADFAEPHLFHTLRNRLINMRMQEGQPLGQMEEGEKEDQDRERMEEAVKSMSEKMGIIHLRYLVEALCDRFERMIHLLLEPRSLNLSASPLVPRPLTLERFRIVELYAELLHSSNMSILNRTDGTGPTYTSEGILTGGLAGLELLGEAIDEERDTANDANPGDDEDEESGGMTKAKELPVSSSASAASNDLSEEDLNMNLSDDEKSLEDIEEEEVTPSGSPNNSTEDIRNQEAQTPTRRPSTIPPTSTSEAENNRTDDRLSDIKIDVTEIENDKLDEPPEIPPAPSLEDRERLRNVMEAEPGSIGSSELGGASNIAVEGSAAPSITSENPDVPETQETPESGTLLPTEEAPTKENSIQRKKSIASLKKVESQPVVGERLKAIYLTYNVIPLLVDFFFDFKDNDFLHHVIYDTLQQILNGRLGPGHNRDLIVQMICGAKLVERILEAERYNDQIVAAKKPRLGYMGHLTLIAEEIVKFLSRCPPDLLEVVTPFIPKDQWSAFVTTTLEETREKDSKPLAGGKPALVPAGTVVDAGAAKEGEESSSDSDSDSDDGGTERRLGGFGTFGEPLTRTKASEGFADRGGDGSGSEEDEPERFWKAVGQTSTRRHVDSSDEDEDDADWLRPSTNEFGGFQSTSHATSHDDFDDDDTWGSFSSAGPSSAPNDSENPFGDDNFAPSSDSFKPSVPARRPNIDTKPPPLTPRDWFDQEFTTAWAENENGNTESPREDSDDNPDLPAIVVPEEDKDDGEVDLPTTPGSTWSFTGDEGEGEELPHAISPTIEGGSPQQETASSPIMPDIPKSISPLPIPENKQSRHHRSASIDESASTPLPIPTRSPSTSNSALSTSPSTSAPYPPPPTASPKKSRPPPPPPPASRKRRESSHSADQAILTQAADSQEPLGPGVSPDVDVTPSGMLEREINGQKIVVPKDEVVSAVEEAVGEDMVGFQVRERRKSSSQGT